MRKTIVIWLGCWMMGTFNPLPAQQLPVPGMGSAQRMQSMLPGPELLERFGQQNQSAGASVSCSGTSHPLFTFAGPDMQSHVWADPHLGGQMLVLQGELMKAMGQVLIKQGQALLEEAPEAAAEKPEGEQ